MPMHSPSTASKATPASYRAGEKRSNPVRIFQFVSYSADNYSTPKPDLANDNQQNRSGDFTGFGIPVHLCSALL
jgi:hypothetical protein